MMFVTTSMTTGRISEVPLIVDLILRTSSIHPQNFLNLALFVTILGLSFGYSYTPSGDTKHPFLLVTIL